MNHNEDATTYINRRLIENAGHEERYAALQKSRAAALEEYEADAPARHAAFEHKLATDPEFAALVAKLRANNQLVR